MGVPMAANLARAGYAVQSALESIDGYKIRVAQPGPGLPELTRVRETVMCPW